MPASPQAASSAILERDGRFLLIRRKNPPMADLFAFPGGRAEAGETPAETALREFFEETGIEARNPTLFTTYNLKSEKDGGQHFLLSVFKIEADRDVEAVAADDAADPGWYSAEEIFRLPCPPSVRDCAEKLAALDADR